MAKNYLNKRKVKRSLGPNQWPVWPLSYFLPGDQREEYVGDLVEIGNNLIKKGYPALLVKSGLFLQFVIIILFYLIGSLGFFLNRLEEKEVEK